MTNEIKTESILPFSDNKDKLVEFKGKKDRFNEKEDFEQILRQMKLLVVEGKFFAQSGNNKFTQLENSNNPLNVDEAALEEVLKQKGNKANDDELQSLIDPENRSMKELAEKALFDTIDIGLNTQIIINE